MADSADLPLEVETVTIELTRNSEPLQIAAVTMASLVFIAGMFIFKSSDLFKTFLIMYIYCTF